ncbi:nitroreductase family protein [Geomonas subterranea]|uniref:Nitroreductase family protein n=1 Tax=Geomonas subterranea TaxID=2847989 RepID=A0ABX8LJJ1_9BACT|nr:nitroreductase family protein [Geomonas subterranea]QXE89730.1 nitroreductase family protein [Geomonas subterranea]QXM08154.1 nitroreductase family protein [Geomonas subterranea]
MLEFKVAKEKCTRCGLCVADCPAHVIDTAEGFPLITTEKEAGCYRCQHCFTVCPTGAVSILGLDPAQSTPLVGEWRPDPVQLETLIKGRRSVRRYQPENLEPELMQRLLEVAWHAPTGVNTRQVRFTVIDDCDKLAAFRDELLAGIARLVRDNALPEQLAFFADFVKLWEEQGVDVLFRGAPHLLVASVSSKAVSPLQDCVIALSYFELFAQANGVGTVWDGLAKIAIADLVPQAQATLGIPEDHTLGYCMAFGKPAVQYARTVQHRGALIHRV